MAPGPSAGPDSGVDGRRDRRGCAERGSFVPNPLGDQALDVGGRVGVGLQQVAAAPVPHDDEDQPRRARARIGGENGLLERASVGGLELEAQILGHGGGYVGQRDLALHPPHGRDVTRTVKEERDILQVVPRAGVRVPVPDEVGLLRDELDLPGARRMRSGPYPLHVPRGQAAGRTGEWTKARIVLLAGRGERRLLGAGVLGDR